jgi:DNA-binding transcriptional MerR regulator
MDAELTIQEAAAQTGLSAHTLRYYERIGLIHPVDRAASGHRRYTAGDLGWIDLLKRLRATGMPITRMQQYAALQRKGDSSMPERLRLLEAHRASVLDQIAALQENLAVIEYKIGYYAKVVAEQAEMEQEIS